MACGTGYWTRVAAERAQRVHATDVNDDTLALARAKRYAAPVIFERRDAYAAAAGPARHDAGLAALWLSHVDLARMDAFLRAFHGRLEPGAAVCMFDERASRGAAHSAEPRGRRGQPVRDAPPRRTASSASRSSRTSSTATSSTRRLAPHATDLVHRELRCFWVLEYRVG